MTAFNRTHWIGISLVLAFALTSPAHGQVFRCKDATGKLSFSDRPCDSGQSGALVQRQRSQNQIEQERMQAAEAQYQKEARRAREDNRDTSLAPPMGTVRGSGQPVSEWACRNAQRNFSVTAAGTFNSVKSKAESLRDEEAKVNKACGSNLNDYSNPHAVVERDRQEKAARQAAREQQKPKPTVITHCDPGFCYDDTGGVYHKNGPDFMTGPGGKTCHRSGTFWNCM